MTDIRPALHRTLDSLDPAGLEQLVGDRAEGIGYYRALERSAPETLRLRYIAATRQAELAGFVPAFLTSHNWLPALPGGWRWPAFLEPIGDMKVAGLGSVHANKLTMCLARGHDTPTQTRLFATLIAGLEELGNREGAQLLVVMDVSDRDVARADPVLRQRGFARISAPPQSFLHLPYTSVEDYLASLTRNRRRGLMRNVGRAAAVEVETDADIRGLEDALHALADETRRHAPIQFGGIETAPPDFFPALVKHAPGRHSFVLYRLEGRLIGFALLLQDAEVMFGKTLGLSYPEALTHKVYFLNMLTVIGLAIERGIEWLGLGRLSYETKLALGARLERRWTYLKGVGRYGPGFRLARPFVEGGRLEQGSAPFDVPENLFVTRPDMPQPPVHRIFPADEPTG